MNQFKKQLSFTIFLTYLVILAGAIVRGTGSGLGCPDWPQCFGHWIPPVSVEELPSDYKTQFKVAGKEIADFDAHKTWIEYLNRIIGVILGLNLIYVFIKSFKFKEKEPDLPWFCGGLLILILLQGGVGALVVSTHLKPYVITLHMCLAIVFLFSLLYIRKYCSDLEHFGLSFKPDTKNLPLTKVLIVMTFIQIIFGTQVRESVDEKLVGIMSTGFQTITDDLGWIFYLHRSFSLILLGVTLWSLVWLYRFDTSGSSFKRRLFFLILILCNIFTGIILDKFGFPPQAQPPHLFVAVLALGILYTEFLNQKGTLLS